MHFTIANVAWHRSTYSEISSYVLNLFHICTAHAVKHLTPGYPEIAAPCGTGGDKRLWFNSTGKSALLIAMEQPEE